MDLSLLNTLLSGDLPDAAAAHSAYKYQFRDLPLEFDILPEVHFLPQLLQAGRDPLLQAGRARSPTTACADILRAQRLQDLHHDHPPGLAALRREEPEKEQHLRPVLFRHAGEPGPQAGRPEKNVFLRRFHPQADPGTEDEGFPLFAGAAQRPGQHQRPLLPLRPPRELRRSHRRREEPGNTAGSSTSTTSTTTRSSARSSAPWATTSCWWC